MKGASMKSVQFATISAKGSVVIPRSIREQFGFQPGDQVAFVVVGDSVSLLPVPSGDPVERGLGWLGSGGPPSTEALLADRQWELEREERDLPPPGRNPGGPTRRVAESGSRYPGDDPS